MSNPSTRASTNVVDAMRAMVHAGKLAPGDRFPPERELSQRFGVSRVTLREALKELQELGYVVVRRGPHGGAFVTGLQEPIGAWFARMKADTAQFDALFDLRLGVEMATARFAADRRDPHQVAEMEDSVESLRAAESLGQYREADSRFHELVAIAARSPRLEPLVRQLRGEMFLPLDLFPGRITPEQDAAQHGAILDAIRAQDPDSASALMRVHIERSHRTFHEIFDTPPSTPNLRADS